MGNSQEGKHSTARFTGRGAHATTRASHRRFPWLWLILATSLWPLRSLAAPPLIELGTAPSLMELSDKVEVLVDPSRASSIASVLAPGSDARFVNDPTALPHFVRARGVYWVRFRLHNARPQKRWYLRVPFAPLEHVDAYLLRKGAWTVLRAGAAVPFPERPIPNRVALFPLTFGDAEALTVYLRVDHRGETYIPLTLVDEARLATLEQRIGLLWLFYYGLVAGLLLLAVVLYLFRRERLNLLYAAYVASWSAVLMQRDGLLQVLFDGILPYPLQRWLGILNNDLALPLVFVGFSSVLLSTRDVAPRLHRLLLWLLGLYLVARGVALGAGGLADSAFNLASLLLVVLNLLLLTAAVMAYRRGSEAGLYYLVAFGVFLAGVVGFNLEKAGFLTWETTAAAQDSGIAGLLLSHFARLGVLFEFSVLTSYLVRRFRQLDREHGELQQTVLERQQEHNRELERVNRELRHMDRLKDELLANTSHEFKTPVQAMVGIAEGLATRDDLPQAVRRGLNVVHTSGLRLSHLVDDILDLSRLRSGALALRPAAVDLRSSVDTAHALLQAAMARKALKFVNGVPAQLPPVWADEGRVQQILVNLMGNAVRYSERGTIRVAADAAGTHARIRVEDEGVGIPPEFRETIFERFGRAPNGSGHHAQGIGLGLTLTRELVERQGGEISVASTIGHGSVFTFTLPLAADEALPDPIARTPVVQEPPETDAPGPAPAPPRPGQRMLLLVDDEPLNREVIGGLLRRHDYHVLEATDGHEALTVLEEHPVELVLLDIMMPRMDGFATCARIREAHAAHRMPVLLLTAMPRSGNVGEGFRCGANDYLEKPVREEELLARVSAHLTLKDLAHLQEDRSLLLQLRRSWEASREQLTGFLDLMREPVLLLDPGFGIVHANRAAVGRFGGAGTTGLVGTPLDRLFAHDLRPDAIDGSPVQLRSVARTQGKGVAADLTLVRLPQARNPVHLCLIRECGGPSPHEADTRTDLVELMNLALATWEAVTGKDRFDLAEESRLWRVQIDDGRLRTRVMDRYCQLKTLPRFPRWKDVVRTAEFVLKRADDAAPPGSLDRLAELEAKASALRQRMMLQ